SAGQGNARAAFSLANLFADSDPPDSQAAAHWLARARQLGFSAPTAPPGPVAAQQAQQGPPSSLLPAAQLKDPGVRRDALWLAATDGDMPSLEILADPALVSARDEFGRGALARAAEAGSAPAVTLLIRRGAAVDAADEHGMTPLMLAARAGELAAVEALFAAHPRIDAADRDRNTALMHAAISGRLAVVDRLLTAGASVAPRDVQDWSALDFAEVRGAADIVARLREKGATALHRSAIVSESRPTAVQRAQRDLYAGWPDLAVGASRDTPELLHALLQHGANPNATTPDGLPILTVAVLAGTPSSIEALLAAGAKATRPDRRGNSALLDAVRVGREDIVLSMLAHGVSPDSRWDPEPPVVAAAKAGHGGILRALLAVHAQPDVRDEHGTSALMLVAQSADLESLR